MALGRTALQGGELEGRNQTEASIQHSDRAPRLQQHAGVLKTGSERNWERACKEGWRDSIIRCLRGAEECEGELGLGLERQRAYVQRSHGLHPLDLCRRLSQTSRAHTRQ